MGESAVQAGLIAQLANLERILNQFNQSSYSGGRHAITWGGSTGPAGIRTHDRGCPHNNAQSYGTVSAGRREMSDELSTVFPWGQLHLLWGQVAHHGQSRQSETGLYSKSWGCAQ
jgi:hypothetical protein